MTVNKYYMISPE